MRRRNEQPHDDLEETFAGEPLPIRFGQPPPDFGLDEGTERIIFPPPGGPRATPILDQLAQARPNPRPRRGPNGLVRGLVLGCLIGAVAGGFVALGLSRMQSRPATVADAPAPVLAQSLTPSPLSAPIAAGEAATQSAPAPADPPIVTPPPAKRAGLDLASLAKAVGLRAPNAPIANAPAAQAGDDIGLRPAAEDMPRLPTAATASARAPIDPPQVIAPAPVERLAVGPLTPPTTVARPPVASPSFDCAGARSHAEQTICGDASLALADRRLLLAYDRAMAGTKDRAGLHEDQAQWLSARDQIGGDREALSAAYQARIRDLEAYDRRNRRVGLGKLLP